MLSHLEEMLTPHPTGLAKVFPFPSRLCGMHGSWGCTWFAVRAMRLPLPWGKEKGDPPGEKRGRSGFPGSESLKGRALSALALSGVKGVPSSPPSSCAGSEKLCPRAIERPNPREAQGGCSAAFSTLGECVIPSITAVQVSSLLQGNSHQPHINFRSAVDLNLQG